MKLCVDCKYHKEEASISHEYDSRVYHSCHKYVYLHTDPVTGKKTERGIKACEDERRSFAKKACGEEGINWEPKTQEQKLADIDEEYIGLWLKIASWPIWRK